MTRSMITVRSKVIIALTAAGMFVAAMVFAAAPAFAANVSSSCPVSPQSGVDCVFWGQSYNNSHSGVYPDVSNFPVSGSTGYVYLSSGTGQGEYLGNNNGSNRNTDSAIRLQLWYNPNYSGYEVTLSYYGTSGYQKAGSGLGNLLNNIRSQFWIA